MAIWLWIFCYEQFFCLLLLLEVVCWLFWRKNEIVFSSNSKDPAWLRFTDLLHYLRFLSAS
ncbi:hypothetical protein NC653_011479 [Populus alba x Populus x berolinensis]|uniref:Uncharacterized protein n=1 Tax=Populus alba x Populus x berolinensis TaxID=444605 RepID=A0AAD6R2C5_9ROSI|nr:hypothetical protein NC653_011479 [Populus alba x Populus x berolinensis]